MESEDDMSTISLLDDKDEKKNYKTINDLLIEDELNITEKSRITPYLMGIYTSVYLFCETLQNSDLISKSHHEPITVYSYCYNLFFIWLVCYSLINYDYIFFKKKMTICQIYLYFIFCLVGGLGFALLGEVPGLQNFVFQGDWWKHLNMAEIIAFVLIGCPILVMFILELKHSFEEKRMTKQLAMISGVFGAYFFLLILMISNQAQEVHYHVHHAIFAGVLSLWFMDWDLNYIIFLHAILMGVVIEGINFYGITEFYLFLCKNSAVLSTTVLFLLGTVWSLFFIILIMVSF
tara:strand:- start:3539 stop:4411 length:873 start_codon:yes stop_codon:yes gene_type:complete